MGRGELAVDWRDKVNPFFVLAIQLLGIIPSIIRQLALGGSEGKEQAKSIFVARCRESLALLPPEVAERRNGTTDFTEALVTQRENKWLADPAVRNAVGQIAARVQNAPEPLLQKGFQRPHWWMAHDSWSEALQKERMLISGLNALALLHFQIPLEVLKQRVAGGDPDLFSKLFRVDSKMLQNQAVSLSSLLNEVSDEATRIIGNALLLRSEPARHQLEMRLILFFGWDFGLGDLSNDQLYSFLRETRIIPSSYDPESLRRYRNRLRQLMRKARSRQLPHLTHNASQ